MHCCHIAASCLVTYTSVAFYRLHYGSISRGVTRGKGGAITRAPNHSAGAEWLQGRQNVPTMSHVHSSIQYICFRKTSGSKMGAPNLLLPRAPSNLVTPLSIWRLVPSRNPSTHFYVAKLQCRQTVDSRTALAIALKLVFRFHFGDL